MMSGSSSSRGVPGMNDAAQRQDGDHERRLQLSPARVGGHHDRAEHDQDELDAVHARGP